MTTILTYVTRQSHRDEPQAQELPPRIPISSRPERRVAKCVGCDSTELVQEDGSTVESIYILEVGYLCAVCKGQRNEDSEIKMERQLSGSTQLDNSPRISSPGRQSCLPSPSVDLMQTQPIPARTYGTMLEEWSAVHERGVLMQIKGVLRNTSRMAKLSEVLQRVLDLLAMTVLPDSPLFLLPATRGIPHFFWMECFVTE